MKALLLSLLLLPLVAKGQDVALPFFAADPAASSSAELPQSANITMYWDSETSPQGKLLWWRDQTNSVLLSVLATNEARGYMYNTPDGMIMGSGAMANYGYAWVLPSKSLGSNYTMWVTFKREDWQTTRHLMLGTTTGQVMSDDIGWDALFNMSSPYRIAPNTNHVLARWTDVVITLTNRETYGAYIDGTLKTNQPWYAEGTFGAIAAPYSAYVNMERVGQIVIWTNKILTASEVLTLHQRMTNQMVNTPSVTNTPPSFSGLRNAWRTAGYNGRMGRVWTDSVSGQTFSMVVDGDGAVDSQMNAIVATGRGARNWSQQSGIYALNAWGSGTMTLPATYTMFLAFTPYLSGYAETAYMFYGPSGGFMAWKADSQRLQYNTGSPGVDVISPVLANNELHTIMVTYGGINSTSYVDGVYFTNWPGNWASQTLQSLGNCFHAATWGCQFNGYISEFLIYTNTSLATNEAVAYHTYGTNQYKFDYSSITNTTVIATNQFGYFYMPSTSSIWASPIVQQQINDNNYSQFAKTSWGHQKIKNTSSTETRIKKIRYKFKEAAGVAISAYAFISRTNDGLMSYDLNPTYTATNALSASAPTLWRDFIYSDVDTPIIPANTDFYIFLRFDSVGAGIIEQRLNSIAGGTGYQDTSYAWDQGTSELTPTLDACFQIYACTNEVYVACTSSNVWTSPILQEQLTDNNSGLASASQWSFQFIKNTSSSAVRIKAVRFKLQNQGGATGQNIYAMARNDSALSNGIEYGNYSRTNVFSGTVSGPAVWETFTWADNSEPLIPASTDFYIGFRTESDSVYAMFQRNIGTGNAYQDSTYNWMGSPNDDMEFQIYVCP